MILVFLLIIDSPMMLIHWRAYTRRGAAQRPQGGPFSSLSERESLPLERSDDPRVLGAGIHFYGKNQSLEPDQLAWELPCAARVQRVRQARSFSVSKQEDKQEIAELERLNHELTRSLQRCRRLLFDCRSQLAANTNMPELLDDQSEEVRDHGS